MEWSDSTVQLAVAVKVSDGHRPQRRANGRRINGALKSPISISRQHTDIRAGAIGICADQIGLAIAIKIAYGYRLRNNGYRIIDSALKRSCIRSQQHAEATPKRISRSEERR